MNLLGRIFVILFFALAVVGVTVSVTDTSASNNNFRDRDFTAENEAAIVGENNTMLSENSNFRPERDDHHNDSFNLFGAVSLLGTIAKVGIITLIVHNIGRVLKKRQPKEKFSSEKTPDPDNLAPQE